MLRVGDRLTPDASWGRFALVLLYVAAAALRLLYVAFSGGTTFGDEEEYVAGAARLLDGLPLCQKNWMLFVRAPGYATFIAGVWAVTGTRSTTAVMVAQSLVAAGTVVYVALLAQRLAGRGAAVLAGAAAAVYPYLVHPVGSLGTEAVFGFCVAASAYHVTRGLDAEFDWPHVIGGAFLWAAGNMLRPNVSTVLPLLSLWILWRWGRRPAALAKVGLALGLPIVLTALPWTFSCAAQGFGFVWVTDGGGIWYYNGHNDNAHRLYCGDLTAAEKLELNDFPGTPFTRTALYAEAQRAPVREQQSVFWRAAFDWDRSHLSALPCVMLHKLVGYWRPWVAPYAYGRVAVLVSLAAVPVLGLGLFGLLRGPRDALWAWALANIVAGTVVAVVFSTQIRYRVPMVDVLLLPYFGAAVETLRRRLGAARG
jgi:4-amino-4-deoxy-L-arabinose transferase-like glycosyltransferase